jgi:O-acetyl-ADP-ribose deacetylase (regulator of RNase III)
MNDRFQAKHGQIELVMGNIVEQVVDAIVNAANTKLAGGGGVDGAINRAAGPTLVEQCELLPADERGRRCPTGEVRVTGAGKLEARWVIHAVGPFYTERYANKAREQLRQVHERALVEAANRGCRSVAFPAISTGAYRFPIAEAATIALETAKHHLGKPQSVELVRFVLFKPAQLEVFRDALRELSPK